MQRMPSTDKIRDRPENVEKMRGTIRARLRDLGISAREASRRAGFNLGYVGDILEGRSKAPDAERVLKLADALDLDAAELLGESVAVAAESRNVDRGARPLGEERRGGGRTLPLYAAPLPINRQFIAFESEPVGRVPCPFMLLDNAEAYAVTVPNSASSPRYFPGEIVFPAPGRTPKIRDFVFIRCKGGDAGVGQLVELTGDSVVLDFPGLEGDESRAKIRFDDLSAMHPIIVSITP
jgi:transcriptional regulator with XRE-family HTH domain